MSKVTIVLSQESSDQIRLALRDRKALIEQQIKVADDLGDPMEILVKNIQKCEAAELKLGMENE